MSQSRFSVFDFIKALQAKVLSELAKVHAAKDVEVHDFDNEVERKKLEAMMEKILALQDSNGKFTPADVEPSLKEQIRQLLAANLIQVYVNEKERSWGSTKLGHTFAVYQNIIENAIALPVGEGKAIRADNFLLPENYKRSSESEFLKSFLGLIDSSALVESIFKDAMLHLDASATAHASHMQNKKDAESDRTYKDELEKYVSSLKVVVRLQSGINYWNDCVAKYCQNVFFNLYYYKSKKESAIRAKAKKLIENSHGETEATIVDLHRVASIFKETSPKADKLVVHMHSPAFSNPPAPPMAMHIVGESELIRATATPPSVNKRLTAARLSDSPTSTPPSQTSRLAGIPTGTPPRTPEQIERRLQQVMEPIVHPSPPISAIKPHTMDAILEVETKDVSKGAALTSTNVEVSPSLTPPLAPSMLPASSASVTAPPIAPVFASADSNSVPTPPPMSSANNIVAAPPAPPISDAVLLPPPPPALSSTAKATKAVAAKPAPASVLSAPDFASQLAARRTQGLKKVTTVDKSAPVIESAKPAAPALTTTTMTSARGLSDPSLAGVLAQGVKGLRKTDRSTSDAKGIANPAPSAPAVSVPKDGAPSPTSVAAAAAALSSKGIFAGSVNVVGSSPVTSPVTSPTSTLPAASTPYRTASGSKYGKDGRPISSSPTSAEQDGSVQLKAKLAQRKLKEAQALEEARRAKEAAMSTSSSPRPGG